MITRTWILPLLLAGLLASTPAWSTPSAPPRGGFTVVDLVHPIIEIRGTDGRVLYGLTPAQVRRLKRAGCAFASRDVVVARRLRDRGFEAEALVLAYEDVAAHAAGAAYCVETAAVWRVLELPWSDLEAHCASGRPLSAYMEGRRARARGLATAGWWLTGVGAALLTIGAIVVIADAPGSVSNQGNDDPSFTWGFTAFLGAPLLAVGLAGLVAGIPMGVVGRRRARRLQLDPDVLDRGSLQQLRAGARRVDLDDLSPDRPSLGLSPAFGRRGGGLSLVLRF
jgi:hypothetical protein